MNSRLCYGIGSRVVDIFGSMMATSSKAVGATILAYTLHHNASLLKTTVVVQPCGVCMIISTALEH
jgi:hypothetical protein